MPTIFALSILVSSTPAPAAPLGDLVALRRDANEFTLETTSGAIVRVSFLADDIIRIQAGPDGTLTGEGSRAAPIVVPQEPYEGAVTVASAEDHEVLASPALELHVRRAPLLLSLHRRGEAESLWRELVPLELDPSGSGQVLSRRPGEQFLGGGQQNGAYAFAGRLLEISYSGGWEEGDRPNPAPMYLSSAGYGVLRNTWTDGRYDFRPEDHLVAFHEEHRFDAYCFVAPDLHGLLERYTRLTGRVPLLPRWALSYGDADCYNDGDNAKKPGTVPPGWSDGPTGTTPDVVASVARRYREHDMPGGWILPNDGYGCGYTDLPAVVDSLRALGFRTGLWTENGVEKIAWEVGTAGTQVQKLDVAWTGEGYQHAMDANREAAEGILRNSDSRPFLWTVMGWAGIQRYAVTWTGDQSGTWDYIRWHVPTLIGSGLSGQAYATGDVDGIFGGSPETFTRDLQWKCFTPVLMGMSGWSKAERKHPWWFEEPYRSINRRYLKLKMRLTPYMYTLAREASETGAPPVRGLLWDHPNDPHAWTEDYPNQFCLGPDLIVAPVFRGERAGGGWREGIHLPAGTWIDYWDGTVTVAGPAGVDVAVPVTLEKLPVFVRAGAILPMVPEALYDGQVPAGVLTLDVYPGGTSGFTLYEDDGNSRAYREGAFSRQEFAVTGEAARPGEVTVTLGPARGAFAGMFEEREYEILVHTRIEPREATLDGEPLERTAPGAPADAPGWSYDPDYRRGVVRVRTPKLSMREAHVVRLTIPPGAKPNDGGAYPPAPARDPAVPADKVLIVSRPTEEPGHPLENAFDGNPDTWFRTVRGQSVPYGPHEFVLDLGARRLVDGIRLRPRNDNYWNYGNARRCEVYVGDVNGEWGAPAFADTLPRADSLQTVRFAPRLGRLLRFRVLSTHDMEVDPMVLAAARDTARGEWRAGEPVRVSPLTIGEFAVLERAPSTMSPERRLAGEAWSFATAGVVRDRAPDGAPLRLAGIEFPRGLSAAGESRVDFDLGPEGASVFRAEVGLADGAPPGARARFRVYGDDRLLWDSGEVGPAVNAAVVPRPILDVRGVRVLSLRAAPSSPSAVAVWANPRVGER